ncbi:O-methyltransferase family 3 protein [Mycena venus]|uniref:O-methyltransferase family 3 protein n=1 Tax=Mycena venus TaxID=2733690 RepID=A0A8H7D1N1_9AGAR|nr:O-methyltransferase family 3 protein [Mycena venus]
MSKDDFEEFPPELILLLSNFLSTPSLNALGSTCRRVHEILQPELESRITPEFALDLLHWAVRASKPHIVAKLLSPPHLVPPEKDNVYLSETDLLVAAKARNTEIARLLLEAGANAAATCGEDDDTALQAATGNGDFEMTKLLLDHGALVDDWALQRACAMGNLGMVKLFLDWGAGANNTPSGKLRSALGTAVRYRRLDVVRYLLDHGADATATVSLYSYSEGGPPPPLRANLLGGRKIQTRSGEGLPLSEEQRVLMAILLSHGASKDTTMATISQHLAALAEEAKHTEEEFLEVTAGMIKEAEGAIPAVVGRAKESTSGI